MEIILATTNNHKKDEIQRILGKKFSIKTMKEKGINLDIEETGSTFEENAIIKARSLKEYFSDSIIIADDSGLEVDALNGQPGVFSARYAGLNANDDDNNKKLLEALKEISIPKRSARFVCVIAIIYPHGKECTIRGECEGKIVFDYKGKAGFGYDPLFMVEGSTKTFGEMNNDEKDSYSHRGKALQILKEVLTKEENIYKAGK